MLNEAMLAARVTEMDFAPEIADLIRAAVLDLKTAGVKIDGVVSIKITRTTNGSTGAETITADDNSTIKDDLVMTAIKTYVRLHFGSPPDYDRLERSYELQRRQLANATGYTDFGEDDGSC